MEGGEDGPFCNWVAGELSVPVAAKSKSSIPGSYMMKRGVACPIELGSGFRERGTRQREKKRGERKRPKFKVESKADISKRWKDN